MTDLPYGADTIVIPFTIIPSPASQPAQRSRTPSAASSGPEQDTEAPDQATMNSTSS